MDKAVVSSSSCEFSRSISPTCNTVINTDKYTAPVVEVEEKSVITIEPRVPDYIPLLDNPPVQSVGNSGWQVSDVWRDIRVDDFCS
ncbi:hypothetical protein [Nostoc sp. ChiQUE01b]|uniref:hypothetical protein n=1 Tax=Nostoc sp. ChiQUE01b TaxID=3075376 RepID=UPI002AD1FCCD|nr:hypothetical protein [Nostoc sp. ChiQUE01b]MDZ8262738.1 hypothetical protein [Nostoc sp. ChiQUE01b]